MLILGVILILVGGILWLAAQSIEERSRKMEDDACFNGMSASGYPQGESPSDMSEDESLLQADIKALDSYVKVLKIVSAVLLAAAALIATAALL